MKITGFAAGPFQTNCYVVINEAREGNAGLKQAFVVDPGYRAFERARGLAAGEGAEIVAVVLTHGHIDHVRDAAEFGVETFIHPDDEFMLAPGAHARGAMAVAFDVENMKETKSVTLVRDGETIQPAGIELTALHAPGHSPGSTLFVNADDRLVLSGDVLFQGSIGRTDLPYSNPDDMDRTLRTAVWGLADDLAVLPGHGPATTVARERAHNPFLRAANSERY